MEKIRVFERACLRACLKKYRSSNSNYKHYVSNSIIYNEAKLPRIDSFIIKLTRDYFAKCKNIDSNPLIKNISEIDNDYIIKCKYSGYIPPEGFTLLDSQGFIQNAENIPIIYHWSRYRKDKKVPFSHHNPPRLKYSTAIAITDVNNTDRINLNKYWWLTNDSKFINDIRQRWKRKKK